MTTVKVNAKKHEMSDLTKKLMQGLDLSFKRLLKQRCKENGTFCFSENGQIITVKAKEVRSMMREK
jgi:hypothetical protein